MEQTNKKSAPFGAPVILAFVCRLTYESRHPMREARACAAVGEAKKRTSPMS
jgi:hypothetical protein